MSEQNRPLLIRGGTVLDGTGADRFAADVRIRDGRIAEIGPGLEAAGDEEIFDASGCFALHGSRGIQSDRFGQCVFVGWHLGPLRYCLARKFDVVLEAIGVRIQTHGLNGTLWRFGEHDRPFNRIFELANITRPGISRDGMARLCAKTQHLRF